MKISRGTPQSKFEPISITLESKEEADLMLVMLKLSQANPPDDLKFLLYLFEGFKCASNMLKALKAHHSLGEYKCAKCGAEISTGDEIDIGLCTSCRDAYDKLCRQLNRTAFDTKKAWLGKPTTKP